MDLLSMPTLRITYWYLSFAATPVVYFILSAFFSCAALNVAQRYRLFFLPWILAPAIQCFNTITNLNVVTPIATALLGHTVIIHFAHITSVLYLDKWTLQPTTKDEPPEWNFHAAYKIWMNPQLLNTKHEVPLARKTTPTPSKTRTRFVLERTLHLAALYLADRYICDPIFPNAFMPFSLDSIHPSRESYFRRLGDVTLYETLLRSVLAVRWIWMNILGLHTAHTGLAFLFAVLLRWDEPSEWAPLFGSPLEAYSIRRFWSRFWHRIAVRPYSAWSICLSKVLGLKQNSTLQKVFVACMVFMISGAGHALVTWRTLGCGFERDLVWFGINALFAVGETFIVGVWNGRKKRETSVLAKVVGMGWVFGFLFWSVPKWEFGKISCVVEGML